MACSVQWSMCSMKCTIADSGIFAGAGAVPNIHFAVCSIGAPAPSKARTGWNWFSSFWYGTRLPLWQRGETQKMNCTAYLCSSFLYGTRLPLGQQAELSCLVSVLLLVVPEAVSSHTKTRSRSAVQSIPGLAPRCPRGSLVPYKSEEHRLCGALLTERTVCGMVCRMKCAACQR